MTEELRAGHLQSESGQRQGEATFVVAKGQRRIGTLLQSPRILVLTLCGEQEISAGVCSIETVVKDVTAHSDAF